MKVEGMTKVTYFDVEYANSKNKSICQIGIVCEDYNTGEPVFPELDIYINPEDGFDNNCVAIHGITASKVAQEKTFPIAWQQIEKYFTNAVVIGHNVLSADLDALVKALRRYNLDIPQMYYIDTMELAKEYVPRYSVPNYSMSALCNYFDIDMDSEHNAFDDACACADLFKTMVDQYDIEPMPRKYFVHDTAEHKTYLDEAVLRKSISEFYGIIRGFSIDDDISEEESTFIKTWKINNEVYKSKLAISKIIESIDAILADGKITNDEIISLQSTISEYLDEVSTSPITLATQILDGILRGITVDGIITETECKNLRQWLYDNIYLSDHFPFNRTIEMVNSILDDGIVTDDEARALSDFITDMLNPVEALREEINSVQDMHVCLSGNFSFGSKSTVESYLTSKGAIIDSGVKKTTDILMIGNEECQAYSNGSYGTKVKKAIEYNQKGCNIKIIKEADYFNN